MKSQPGYPANGSRPTHSAGIVAKFVIAETVTVIDPWHVQRKVWTQIQMSIDGTSSAVL